MSTVEGPLRLRAERDEAVAAASRALAHATQLTRVLTVLSEPAELEALAERLLETLSELFAADVVSLLLLDGEGRLRESAALGLPEADAPEGRAVADPWAQQALESLEPVRGSAPPDDRVVAVCAGGEGVWLPVQGVSQAVGVLRLLRCGGHGFSDEDVDVLSAIASRIGLAVEADRLRTRDQQRSAIRARMLAVTAEMARRLEFEPVAQRIVEGVTAVTDFSCAVVALRDGDVCRRLAASGLADPQIGLETPYAEWAALLDAGRRRGELCYRVPADTAALWSPRETPGRNASRANGDHAHRDTGHGGNGDHAHRDTGDHAHATEAWTSGQGLILALADPEGETVGFLAVDWPRSGRVPGDDTVGALELFARQAQVALANARLLETVRRQRDAATTLRRVAEAVSSSLDVEEVLRRCCDEVTAVSAGHRASIYLFEADRGVFVPVVSRVREGGEDQAARFRELPPATPETMPAFTQALAAGTPLVIDLTSPAEGVRQADAELLDLTCAAIYPMRSGGEDVGVLVVDAAAGTPHFPPDELALLQQVAGQAASAVRQARLHAETRALAGTMRELYEIAKTMTATFDVDAIFARIAAAARGRLDAHGVTMLEVSHGVARIVRADRGEDGQPVAPRTEFPLDAVGQLAERLRQERTVAIPDVAAWPAVARLTLPETRSLLAAAHVEDGEITVALAVSSPRPDAFGQADAAFLGQLVETSALALRHAQLYAETRQAAERDSLTGLRNRRVFWADLRRLLADPAAAPLALAVVDIDDFKRINDCYGHGTGDQALTHVSDRLTRSVRQTDAVYRIGGEEFAVVMPATTGTAASGVMERARDAVQLSRLPSVPMSISVGIAVAQKDVNGDDLFRVADAALYRAKRAGKDRVFMAERQVAPTT